MFGPPTVVLTGGFLYFFYILNLKYKTSINMLILTKPPLMFAAGEQCRSFGTVKFQSFVP